MGKGNAELRTRHRQAPIACATEPLREQIAADKRYGGWANAGTHAELVQDAHVEWRMMRRDETDSVDEPSCLAPDVGKPPGVARLGSGDPVQAREAKAARRRADQTLEPFDHLAADHPDHAQRAGADRPPVGSLEIDRGERRQAHPADRTARIANA